jgi:hypothetical protein
MVLIAALLMSNSTEAELSPGATPAPGFVDAATPADPKIPSKQMVSAEELNQLLKTQKALVLQVGPRYMYEQAHIPGAEYIGATWNAEGLDALRARIKSVPKDTLVVLYCGCCPWDRCPNIHPAYEELRDLGYSNLRVLFVANNFGADWVNKGYPTEKSH